MRARAMVPEVFGTQAPRSRHPRVRFSKLDSQWGGGLGYQGRPAPRDVSSSRRVPRVAGGTSRLPQTPHWSAARPGATRPLDRRRSYTRRVDERALGRVEERASGGRRLAWKTAVFSVAAGRSRILGLVREIVAAYFFSATGKINAFTVAFQVPNLIRSLVADAAL